MGDAEDIQAVVDTLFAAFDSGPGLTERMAGLRGLFVPGAVVTRIEDAEVVTMSVEEFVAPRDALLGGDRVTRFREWETAGRTEQFRGVAQHWSSYAKSWVEQGREHHGRGAKSLQLVRGEQGWRIAALAWDDHPSQ
jgi:hypothetical protein